MNLLNRCGKEHGCGTKTARFMANHSPEALEGVNLEMQRESVLHFQIDSFLVYLSFQVLVTVSESPAKKSTLTPRSEM